MNTFDLFTQIEELSGINNYEELLSDIEEYIKECVHDTANELLQHCIQKIEVEGIQSLTLYGWNKYITNIYETVLSSSEKELLEIGCDICDSKDFFHQVLFYLF